MPAGATKGTGTSKTRSLSPLSWLFRRVPAGATTGTGTSKTRSQSPSAPVDQPNPLPAVERWKIFDNLRRSLVPPALILLLILGWTVAPGTAWVWTVAALVVLFQPALLLVFTGLLNLVRGFSPGVQLREVRSELPATLGQVLLTTTFLADQARLMLDAIGRTLYRLFVSRQHLLEWETAASTERRMGTSFRDFLLNMWQAPALSVFVGLVVLLMHPSSLLLGGPLLALWFISPWVAFLVSRSRLAVESPLTALERSDLRRITQNLGFLRDLRRCSRSLAAARQLSGKSQGRGRSPNLTHQHGLAPAVESRRPRPGVPQFDTAYRPAGKFLRHVRSTRTLSRPFPQLVRHRIAQTAPARIRLQRGQRQSHGLLANSEAGTSRKDGRTHTQPRLPRWSGGHLATGGRKHAKHRTTGATRPVEIFRGLEQGVAMLHTWLQDNPTTLSSWNEWLERMEQQAQTQIDETQALARAIREKPDELLLWTARFADQVRGHRQELRGSGPMVSLAETDRRTPFQKNHPHQGLAQPLGCPCFWTVLPSAAWRSSRGKSTHLGLSRTQVKRRSWKPYVHRPPSICWHAASAWPTEPAPWPWRWISRSSTTNSAAYFAIGYHIGLARLDSSYYDLLASEARLASFLAIAHGDADRRHWFQLGRP